MYYFFPEEQNVSKKFSLMVIEERNNEKKVIFRNQLKKLNFDKTFQDNVANELDFHSYGTAKIEIQQQPDDINPFTYELHQTLYDILEFKVESDKYHPGLQK